MLAFEALIHWLTQMALTRHIIGEIHPSPKSFKTKSVTRLRKGARMRELCGLMSSFFELYSLHS